MKPKTQSSKLSLKWKVSIITLVALSVLSFAALVVNFTPSINGNFSLSDQYHEKAKMVKFLRSRYGEEFKVETLTKGTGSIGAIYTINGLAYPVSNPSLAFKITRQSKPDKDNYNDNYLDVLWSMQANEDFGNYLTSKSEKVKDFRVQVSPLNSLRDSIRGHAPSFKEALRKNGNQVGYKLTINDTAVLNQSAPSDNTLEKAFGFLAYVKSLNTGIGTYIYRFNTDDFLDNSSQYTISLSQADFAEVNKSNDLMRFFVKTN